jgi:hypothetical protein
LNDTQDSWAKLHKSSDVAESGGEENNTATDFARHWAIAHIVQVLIDKAGDYVILFEYLQDVAVLDSSLTPTKIALYQLKKRARPSWTPSSLTAIKSSSSKESEEPAKKKGGVKKRKGLKGRSILGKLYLAVESANSLADASGVLLTDCHFDLKGTDGQRVPAFSKTSVTKLGEADLDFISKRLKKEIADQELKHLGSLEIEQTRMNPAGMREYVRGAISEFLEVKFPNKPNVSGAILEKMLEEFGKLSGTTPACNCLADLVHHKGFTKAQFADLVADSIPARSWDERLASLVADLKAEGVTNRLADNWHQRAVTVHTGIVLSPQRAFVYDWELAKTIARTTINLSYKASVESIVTALRTEALDQGLEQLDNNELAAAALVAILDVQTESSSADTEPAEGQR